MKKYIEEGNIALATCSTSTSRPGVSISRAGVFLLNAHVASSWLARFKGLFAHTPVSNTDALILSPCSAIHTMGLNYAIDVVFLGMSGQVLKCANVRPNSLAVCWAAHSVIEMTSGTAHRLNLSVGQRLVLEEQS